MRHAAGRHGRIHSVVRAIPAGRVLTYGDVAALAEMPGQARLVGYALHALPAHSTVPWHRVINHRGGLSTGRAAPGGELLQRRRLEAEGVEFDANGRTSLRRYRWVPPAGEPLAGEPAVVLTTPRLVLRRLRLDDAPFVLELVNDPDWLRHIGDRGVRTEEDARDYLRRGPLAMYEHVGFGLFAVERRAGGEPVGICGLIDREALQDVDVGFAFLAGYRGQGYAREAAAATVEYGLRTLRLPRIVAVVSPGNEASVRLLEALGLAETGTVRLSEDGPELRLFATGAS